GRGVGVHSLQDEGHGALLLGVEPLLERDQLLLVGGELLGQRRVVLGLEGTLLVGVDVGELDRSPGLHPVREVHEATLAWAPSVPRLPRMALRLEDYALLGDTSTAALVGVDGSIDWLCLPRFDSSACFAALLGKPEHGRWKIAPRGRVIAARRRYRPGTMVLETELECDEGAIRLVDFMPPRDGQPNVVRIVEGLRGRVPVRMELVVRFDYGSLVPWVRRIDGATRAIAGPDALTLRTPLETRGEDLTTVADATVGHGDRIPFQLVWHQSWEDAPAPLDVDEQLRATARFW